VKIVVALDSFKGSLTSEAACCLVTATLRGMRPQWQVESQPMADGGEGTASVLVESCRGEWCTAANVTGPLPGMELDASYGWLAESRTAVVEMARASGLALLPIGKRNPLLTTTLGTGQLMAAAACRGAELILLALGGSATVDGGTGAARALGWGFLDGRGREVPMGGGHLSRIERLVPPARKFPAVDVLCDVNNPLCGAQGAARVFGPQKGATPAMIEQLEQGLLHLADVVRNQLGVELVEIPGGGAAGGFGAGAVAFFQARLLSGISVVMETVGLERALRDADWVISGEGCFDAQSLQGKVVSGVRDAARRQGVRIAVIAGRVALDPHDWQKEDIALVEETMPAGMALEKAMSQAGPLLVAAARRLVLALE
jgi:glycerate kinase